MDIYWPSSLPLPILGVSDVVSALGIVTVMDSGRTRNRPLAEEPLPLADVKWVFTEDDFYSFLVFFEDTLQNGSQMFYLNIFRDEQPAAFFDANFTFTRNDNQFTVSASLVLFPEDDVRICVEGDIRMTVDGCKRIIGGGGIVAGVPLTTDDGTTLTGDDGTTLTTG